MCGIIAYKGNREAKEVVVKGLKKLEYRGYDSFGVVSICEQGSSGALSVFKKVGKIGGFSLDALGTKKSGNAMGHTRWATHGGVTKENAHPHISNNGKVAVVHNGIVENYQALRKKLAEKGFKLKTETDTEVIPNLIQLHLKTKSSLLNAVKATLKEIEGSYAVVVMHSDFDELIGARRGSPLVMGIGKDRKGKNEYFLASDVPAFLEFCNKVIYLDDDELAYIGKKYEIIDLAKNKKIKKPIKKITWSTKQAEKGNYPHFMLKEINEQKFTIEQAAKQDPKKLKKAINMIKKAKGVFFVGCGTSYHACVSSSYTFSHIAKEHVNVVLASEFRNYENFLTDETLMVAVSQSGETADLLDAIKVAKKKGVKIIAVTNVMGSTLTRQSDLNLMMNSGPEICVLSTKTYTAQIAILVLLAYGAAGRLEKARRLISQVSKAVPEVIKSNLKNLEKLASKIKNKENMFLLGRDLAFPTALEGALKIKEVSYIHAEGFAGGELKHGTIALIEKGTPVITFVTKWTKQLILSNTMEVKSRGAFIVGIDSEENELYDNFIKVPELGNANPIIMIIPVQILAYYLALKRGCDPDKPRNLAKSVTVK